MNVNRYLAALLCAGLLTCRPAAATNLVTDNGFGFAVVSPETGAITRFYAHPYSFAQPDSANPLSEGIETANFITRLAWNEGTPRIITADYDQDSHVIHAVSSGGEGLVFMPFGLRQTALVIGWRPSAFSRGHWDVAVPCPLFPGATGDPTGARPMAGYGAGAYVLDVIDQGGSATRQ